MSSHSFVANLKTLSNVVLILALRFGILFLMKDLVT